MIALTEAIAGQPPAVVLPGGLPFDDLYTQAGMVGLDGQFIDYLDQVAPELKTALNAARENPAAVPPKEASSLLVNIAPHLEDFLARVFGIESELNELRNQHSALAPLHAVKRKFVQRRVTAFTADQAAAIDGWALRAELEMLFGQSLLGVELCPACVALARSGAGASRATAACR